MNNRIKELAAEAKEYSKEFNFQHEVFERKFAELIVKECLLYAKDGDIDFMKFMIKKHFGVEE